jgi:hypothetical protein
MFRLLANRLELVEKGTKWHITALKMTSKCSPIHYRLRFLFHPSGYVLICSRQINQPFLPGTALIGFLFQQALR